MVAVVVDYHAGDALVACLDSLQDEGLEVVVVDNAGSGTAAASLAGRSGVTLIESARNLGYGAGVNRGAAATDAPFLLVCNPDLVVHPGAAAALREALVEHRNWGIAAPSIVTPEGERYPSVRGFPNVLVAAGHALLGRMWPANPWTRRYLSNTSGDENWGVDWVSGACFAIDRSAFEAVGGFDEGYFMFAEDLDLCYRLHQAGYGVGVVEAAVVTHVEGVSRRRQPYKMLVAHHRSALRFQARSARGVSRLLLPLAALVLAIRLGVVVLAQGLRR